MTHHQQHQIKLISCIIVLVLLIVLVTSEQTLNKDDAAQPSPNNPQTRLEEGLPQLHPIDSIVNKVEKDPLKILTQNFALSCDVCKFVVDETEMYLREHEPEIEKKLVHLCGYLPMQYEQLCDTIVLMYGHTILEMLERYENSTTICEQQLHLCIPSKIASADSPIEINRPNSLKGTLQQAQELDKTKGSSSLRLMHQRFGDEMECTLCEMMVAWIEHFLQNNSTHHEIEHWLKSVCLRLPSSVTGTCVAMVKQYVPFIIEKLEKKFPPHRVCKDIVPMCSFKRFEPFAGALIDDPYTSTCALCKNVTKILYSKLDAEDWKDAEKVEHVLLHHVCKHMPYKYRNKCKQFVLAADPVMIMDRYYTRKDQCVKECEVDLKTDEIEMQKNQIVTFPIICACCRYLVNIVDHYITKKSTEKEIMHVVEQVCPFFPRTYRTECVTLVEKYGDSIVKILATYIFSPSTVCFLSHCCG